VVITYNSAKTVLETLDSIKTQTYQNIELIISDDCSKDNTAEIVVEWLNRNSPRFVYAELITTDVNTGVSGNINRGVAKSHGDWIKSIAGDDILIPTAIEEYVNFVTNHSDKVQMCVCDVELFTDDGEVPEYRKQEYQRYFNVEKEPYPEQYLRCMQGNIFVGPGFFYTRKLYDEVRGFSAEYGNGEEWPFVYKVLRCGNRIYAIEKKLVRYRFSQSSLSHSKSELGLRNKNLELSTCRFFFAMPFKDLLREHRYIIAWDRFLYYGSTKLYYEHDGATWAMTIMKLSRYLTPYTYWKKIKSIILKE